MGSLSLEVRASACTSAIHKVSNIHQKDIDTDLSESLKSNLNKRAAVKITQPAL